MQNALANSPPFYKIVYVYKFETIPFDNIDHHANTSTILKLL